MKLNASLFLKDNMYISTQVYIKQLRPLCNKLAYWEPCVWLMAMVTVYSIVNRCDAGHLQYVNLKVSLLFAFFPLCVYTEGYFMYLNSDKHWVLVLTYRCINTTDECWVIHSLKLNQNVFCFQKERLDSYHCICSILNIFYYKINHHLSVYSVYLIFWTMCV